MRFLFLIITVILFSTSVKYDFMKSQWGDSLEKVIAAYEGEKVITKDKDSFVIEKELHGKTALLYFLFHKNEMVSAYIRFNEMSGDETMEIYRIMQKELTARFGKENFNANKKLYDGHEFNQILWNDERTVASMRMDKKTLVVVYADIVRMPMH